MIGRYVLTNRSPAHRPHNVIAPYALYSQGHMCVVLTIHSYLRENCVLSHKFVVCIHSYVWATPCTLWNVVRKGYCYTTL